MVKGKKRPSKFIRFSTKARKTDPRSSKHSVGHKTGTLRKCNIQSINIPKGRIHATNIHFPKEIRENKTKQSLFISTGIPKETTGILKKVQTEKSSLQDLEKKKLRQKTLHQTLYNLEILRYARHIDEQCTDEEVDENDDEVSERDTTEQEDSTEDSESDADSIVTSQRRSFTTQS